MAQFELQKKMRDYYNENSYFPDVKTYEDMLNTLFQKYRITHIKMIYAPDKEDRVLDLGCALGTFCFALAPHCEKIIGVDYSRKAIGLAHEILRKSPYTNITFACMDAQQIGLASESFDVIICADLFEHLFPEVFETVLDECRRLLKRYGKLVIWTPHKGHLFEILKNNNIILKRDITHVDYKSMDDLLKSLKKRNFLIRKAYYAESQFPVFRVVEKLLLSVLPIMRRRIAILAEKGK